MEREEGRPSHHSQEADSLLTVRKRHANTNHATRKLSELADEKPFKLNHKTIKTL